jgi:FlgN protein
MGVTDVSTILWRERELLDLLLFKLEEEQLVLATGRTRWLAHAAREVEVVLTEIRRIELMRAVEVDGLAAELGLAPAPSLAALAEAVDEQWRQILREHHAAFRAATDEISAMAKANSELLSAGYRAACDALLTVDGSPDTDTYTARGVPNHPSSRRPVTLDEAI